MDLFAIFFNSFIVGFSGAIMPGPLLVVDMAETPRNGWKTGPVISIGHAIAEIGVVVVLSLGVLAIAEDSLAARIIGVVGGAALILMALMMGWDLFTNKIVYSKGEDKDKENHWLLTGKGITATLSNPYWFVWWATVGLALLVQSKSHGWAGPTAFYFGHIMSDFVWYTFVSILLWKGRRLLMGRGLKALILACAAFLVYLGVWFISDGIS